MDVKRHKMCKGKVSFTNLSAATRVAEKHNQRVYECPVCFCFHCTSKDNWRDEFVPIEKYQNVVRQVEQLLKRGAKLDRQRVLCHELSVENARLRKELKKYTAQQKEK